MTGYSRALEDGMDIMVKVDGDGQMDPNLIPELIRPIVNLDADNSRPMDQLSGQLANPRAPDADPLWQFVEILGEVSPASLGQDASAADENHRIGGRLDLFHDMAGNEQGLALLGQVEEKLTKLSPTNGIEPGKRLVED